MKIEDFEILKMPAIKIRETLAKESGTLTEFERAIKTAVELLPEDQIEVLHAYEEKTAGQTVQDALQAAGHAVFRRL